MLIGRRPFAGHIPLPALAKRNGFSALSVHESLGEYQPKTIPPSDATRLGSCTSNENAYIQHTHPTHTDRYCAYRIWFGLAHEENPPIWHPFELVYIGEESSVHRVKFQEENLLVSMSHLSFSFLSLALYGVRDTNTICRFICRPSSRVLGSANVPAK